MILFFVNIGTYQLLNIFSKAFIAILLCLTATFPNCFRFAGGRGVVPCERRTSTCAQLQLHRWWACTPATCTNGAMCPCTHCSHKWSFMHTCPLLLQPSSKQPSTGSQTRGWGPLPSCISSL